MVVPHIVEGEILSVQEKPLIGSTNTIFYTCQVLMPSGGINILPNVEESSLFGGIGDYYRRRARTRTDSNTTYPEHSFKEMDLNASVGERVYIAFINGNILNPVIIGYKQHPNQAGEFFDPKDDSPRMVSQLNGVRNTIDKFGQWRMTHKGAPKIDFKPAGVTTVATSTTAQDALVKSGLGIPGDNSAGITGQGSDQLLVIEMLKDAIFRVRDPKGGLIELNHTGDKKGVYISDNDFTSAENPDFIPFAASGGGLFSFFPDATTAEFLWLNREEETAHIHSRKFMRVTTLGDRADLTRGNNSHVIYKDSLTNIFGNEKISVAGDSAREVAGSHTLSAIGDYNVVCLTGDIFMNVSAGSFEINVLKGLTFSTTLGAGINIQGSTVALGGPTAELLDLFDQTLEQMDLMLTAMQAQTHVGNLGFPTSPPVNVASYVTAQVQVNVIKTLLNTIKGDL